MGGGDTEGVREAGDLGGAGGPRLSEGGRGVAAGVVAPSDRSPEDEREPVAAEDAPPCHSSEGGAAVSEDTLPGCPSEGGRGPVEAVASRGCSSLGARPGVRSGRPGGSGSVGKLMGPVGRGGGGSQGARCGARPFGRGGAGTSSAPVRGPGTTGSAPRGRSGEPPLRLSTPSPTAPDADANRSSSESRAGVGPVSSVESSYNSLHQSSS